MRCLARRSGAFPGLAGDRVMSRIVSSFAVMTKTWTGGELDRLSWAHRRTHEAMYEDKP